MNNKSIAFLKSDILWVLFSIALIGNVAGAKLKNIEKYLSEAELLHDAIRCMSPPKVKVSGSTEEINRFKMSREVILLMAEDRKKAQKISSHLCLDGLDARADIELSKYIRRLKKKNEELILLAEHDLKTSTAHGRR